MSAAAIAVSILAMLVFAAPSEASPSCIGGNEVHQHFSSDDIYRYDQDPCGDATPTRELHEIDVVREAPPSIIERKAEPTVAPGRVVLVAIALVLVLVLGTIEILFRCTTL
jgi:hypothetical protein